MFKSFVTFLSVTVMLLSLITLAAAQTPVSIPLGNLSVTATPPPPPPPPSFTQQVSQPVNVTVTINGVQYNATGTLAGTLTFTPISSTTGTTTGSSSTGGSTTGSSTGSSTTGSTGGGTTGSTTSTAPTITKVVDATGAQITTAPGGSVVTIQGTNLGTGGNVAIAGRLAPSMTWSPTSINVTVPQLVVGTNVAIGAIQVTTNTGAQTTSTFSFTITQSVTTASVQGLFDYSGTPTSTLPAHDVLQISGSGFGTQGGVLFSNAGSAYVESWRDSLIIVAVPDPGNGQVEAAQVIVQPKGQSSVVAGTLTIAPPSVPTIYGLLDSTGAIATAGNSGATITIYGDALSDGGKVNIAGLNATVQTWTPKQIAVVLPPVTSPTTGPVIVNPTNLPAVQRNPLMETGFTINPATS